MAIIWEKAAGGKRYEVRSAGKTRRLYTDGVFHSQYNPDNPITGSVWDLLLLPSFLFNKPIRRVLLLGVGGGAVIQQLRCFHDIEHITGVELDAQHLYVARKFFGVDEDCAQLVEADAVEYVKHYRGKPFDLIIDDLFGEEAGEPVRAVAADAAWLTNLSDLLTPDGMLVINFISRKDMQQCAYFSSAKMRKRFDAALQFTTPLYVNYVLALTSAQFNAKDMHQRVKGNAVLRKARQQNKLRYHIRQL